MQTVAPPSAAAEIVARLKLPGEHLVGVSRVALDVMRLADDRNATGTDLERLIESDPPLSARLLRVANSAFYGARRPASSISGAISLMGFSAVKNIAMAASLSRAFRATGDLGTFDPREVWKHSVAVAVGARLIATRNRKVDPNDAFLAGLMHDIGVMVELQMARRNFISTLVAVGADASLTFREAERQHVGATHETFGDALCVSWNFPSALRAVCAFHHQPLQSESAERVLVCIAHAADVMAARAQLGYSRTVDVAEIGKDVSDVIGISRDEVAVVEAALPDEVASALQTFVT